MGDPEVDAMSAVAAALTTLGEDAQGRVLRWAAERYAVNVPKGVRPGGPAGDRSSTDDDVNDQEIVDHSPAYEHFAELFGKARPDTEADRALVAAYWLQVIQGKNAWQSAALQKELKHLGHASGNITTALTRNIAMKPQRVIQLQKSGSSKQARKTYKVTEEGLAHVRGMLRGESV